MIKVDKVLKIENYSALNFQPVNGDWVLMTAIEFDDTYQFKITNKLTAISRISLLLTSFNCIVLRRKGPTR